MDEYIINSFIFKEINYTEDIFKYTLSHSNNLYITINEIQKHISRLIKTTIIITADSGFKLTAKGQTVLETNTIYYQRILYRFFRRFTSSKNYIKYFELKEKRLEQNYLRTNLIKTREHKCILCDKYLPLCLLETAHLKPRCIITTTDLYNNNIVEFMCRYCHTLYDNGFLSITNSILHISSELTADFDLSYTTDKKIITYNSQNAAFFEFHFKTIFRP